MAYPTTLADSRPALARRVTGLAALAALLGVSVGGLVWSSRTPEIPAPVAAVAAPAPAPVQEAAIAPAPAEEVATPAEPEASFAIGPEAYEAWRSALLESVTPAAPDTPFAQAEAPAEAESQTPAARPVPLPVPRPAELSRPRSPDPARLAARRARVAAAPPQQIEDTRSFFEKMLGIEASPQQPAPALAYASIETGSIDKSPAAKAQTPRLAALPATPLPTPAPETAAPGGGVAVYDISARSVTLPNGERLEAHSGLGETMDDPRYVHMRMRGATPPGTYDLTEREALFHGVRAIRLNPVGGSGAVHGRAGLLAHTYMLGPNGASNGCVSFRDYNRFLQAFLKGEVTRLVVVTGRQDTLPSLAERIFGKPVRTANAGN